MHFWAGGLELLLEIAQEEPQKKKAENAAKNRF